MNSIMALRFLGSLTCCLAILTFPADAAVTINFDVDAAGDPIIAPVGFILSENLTDLYASQNVIFSGVGGPFNGGSILDQVSNFGVPARSGDNFLAFSGGAPNSLGGISTGPEILTFDRPILRAEIYASGGTDNATFTFEAFRDGGLVDSDFRISPVRDYRRLFVEDPDGIDQIVLTEVSGNPTFVLDDLTFSVVPEPASLLLVLCGGLVLVNRRR